MPAVDSGESDTSLSVFTVNGSPVVDGGTVNLDNGTTSVTVVATPTRAGDGATADVSGDTGLVTGDNTLTVTVTAPDEVTTQDYHVTLHVLALQLDPPSNLSIHSNPGGVADAQWTDAASHPLGYVARFVDSASAQVTADESGFSHAFSPVAAGVGTYYVKTKGDGGVNYIESAEISLEIDVNPPA